MDAVRSTSNARGLVLMLERALEKEAECWQSGQYQATAISSDAITGVKRDVVVVWMIDKAEKFGFQPETWALSVTILDRFLHAVKAQAKYLKCIAITCLYIAAKFSEEDQALLTAAELVDKSQCGCSASDVVRMERIIVSKLQWNIRAATPLEFIHIFHAMLLSTNANVFTNSRDAHSQLRALTALARQCAGCHVLLRFRPSTLALGILSLELEQAGAGWLPTTIGLQRLASIDNVSLIQCREKIAYLLAPLNQFASCQSSQLSRPVKRKMISESEDSTPGDEDMYDGIKRLYGPDDDYVLPSAGGGKVGCSAEVIHSVAIGREMATAVAN